MNYELEPEAYLLAPGLEKFYEWDERSQYETSLIDFASYVWPVVEPAIPFIRGWVLDAIAEHLQAVAKSDIRRLLINVPPGFTKSLMTDVFFPAWIWGPLNLPHMRFLCASYSEHLTVRDNLRCRNIILSDRYQRLWKDRFGVSTDQFTKIRFANDKTGWKLATSVGGIGTGERANFLLIDDPNNPMEVESDAIRSSTIMWFTEILPDRLNDQSKDAIVVIQQRTHEEDVSGVALSREMGYTHLCYDAETEVLTRRGWVRFLNLEKGIEVLGVNPKTLAARWQTPTRYIVEPFVGDLLHFKSTTIDLMVTPDHRMIYKNGHDFKKKYSANQWRLATAARLPKNFYIPQAVKWVGGSDEEIYFGGRIWHPDLFAKFIGWYLSEGCASGKRCVSRIVQKQGKSSEEIDDLLTKCSLRYTQEVRKSGVVCFQIWSKDLALALEKLGKSHTKYVPSLVKEMSVERLRAFLLTYAKGDGCAAGRNGRGISISSRSERMIDDLQECATKAGWATTKKMYFSQARKFNNYIMPSGPMWFLYIRSSRIAGLERKLYGQIRPVNIRKSSYAGYVYCVSVPDTAIVVRRNGRVAISGNCVPMEHDVARHCVTVLGFDDEGNEKKWEDPRTEQGELAWPERFPPKVVEELKRDKTEYAWAGQYDQMPAPRGGSIIKRETWQVWDQEKFPTFEYVIGSLDTAYTTKEENDPSALTIWGVFRDPRPKPVAISDPDFYRSANMKVMLMWAWQGRLEFNELIEEVMDTCTVAPIPDVRRAKRAGRPRFPVQTLLIEAKAAGLSVGQEMYRLMSNRGAPMSIYFPNINKGRYTQDKVARLHSVEHIFSSKMVYAPDRAWADMVINQVSVFPKGSHDDLVDCTSQALTYLRESGILERPDEQSIEDERILAYRERTAPLYTPYK